MSGRSPVRYCGRDFTPEELALIRRLAARRDPAPGRTALSRAVCERLGWRKPDGGLKDMSARVAVVRHIIWMGNGCFVSDYLILSRETFAKIVTNP